MSNNEKLEKGMRLQEREKSLSILLDSSLIIPVRFLKYDLKIVRCGDYLQIYFYPETKIKNNIKNLDINGLKNKEENKKKIKTVNTKTKENRILDKNIIRTKLNCQRLAKANADVWESFLTLTYEKNMKDVKQAKKDLEYFVTNIKKEKRDFKYIAIPEFQKRGAVHFHLLSNLNLQDNNIIVKQKSNEDYYDVKYWGKGFSSFESIKGDVKKIVGYIAKYMTKDCDPRLFAIRRFTHSRNLIKPFVEYIDVRCQEHFEYLMNLMKDKECIYLNTYRDCFDNDVTFKEYF